MARPYRGEQLILLASGADDLLVLEAAVVMYAVSASADMECHPHRAG